MSCSSTSRQLPLHPSMKSWRSLDELAGMPSPFADDEFPDRTVSRRDALWLATGLAALGACTRQPEERIVPYVQQPEAVVPGRPLFYATAMPFRGRATGLLIETHEGRPTKVEGNPQHPASLGATLPFHQA